MEQYSQLPHDKHLELATEALLSHIPVEDPLFFRTMISYYFATMASAMRCSIRTPDRNIIPINVYALALAPSGYGKSLSTRLIEGKLIRPFKERLLDEVLPYSAEVNLPKLAVKRAFRENKDPDEVREKLDREYAAMGAYLFNFDSATVPAVKQLRNKLILANAGSINLQIDEIGTNLLSSMDVLGLFLELYDGEVKQKLIKNSAENSRTEEFPGLTPTNMLLFGTPNKLFNGDKQEEELYSMLETGYARRCFFSYVRNSSRKHELNAKELLDKAKNPQSDQAMDSLSAHFYKLADSTQLHRLITIPDDVAEYWYQYKIDCAVEAENFGEHEEIPRIEMIDRAFKALKLAGAYAFVDMSAEIKLEHLQSAIRLAEDSGKAFQQLMTRDRPYVKLARYMAGIKRSVTLADLHEDLPFFRVSKSMKEDMLKLAMAWGYQNNIVIKRNFTSGVEFLCGETLKETDLSRIRIAHSHELAFNYHQEFAPFDALWKLTQIPNGYNWINHWVKGGHREETQCIPGFNVIVVDVDGYASMKTAMQLLDGYKALYYTTKRHTPTDNRYRIIFPMKYELALDANDYKEFMKNFFDWLPFQVDTSTGQRVRKWLCHAGSYQYTDGELIDPLPFIPRTARCEDRRKLLEDQGAMDNLERWMLNSTGDGNRNNMLLRFALILTDAGFDFAAIQARTKDFNSKLQTPLPEAEIDSTILVTVMRKITAQKTP